MTFQIIHRSFLLTGILLLLVPTLTKADSEDLCMLCEHGIQEILWPITIIESDGTTCSTKALDMAVNMKPNTEQCNKEIDEWRSECCGRTPPKAVDLDLAPAGIVRKLGPNNRCGVCHNGDKPSRNNVLSVLYIGAGSCKQFEMAGQQGLIPDYLCDPIQFFSYEPCGCGEFARKETVWAPTPFPYFGDETIAPMAQPTPDPTDPPRASPIALTASPITLSPITAPPLDNNKLSSLLEVSGSEGTPAPTAQPATLSPTSQPTVTPTPGPTPLATAQPTIQPTPNPTLPITKQPSAQPTPNPTLRITGQPSTKPTPNPTLPVTGQPTSNPTPNPTGTPTAKPTNTPTAKPTSNPTPPPSALPIFNIGSDALSQEFEQMLDELVAGVNAGDASDASDGDVVDNSAPVAEASGFYDVPTIDDESTNNSVNREGEENLVIIERNIPENDGKDGLINERGGSGGTGGAVRRGLRVRGSSTA